MPSFDIVSEIDNQEIDNALNQARKELATRFDFKGSIAGIEYEKDTITLTAEDASRLRGLREIVIGKLSKRGVDLRTIDQKEPAISSIGHARQELKIQLQDRQIRVTGKKRDELQEVIAFVKSKDFGVATNFKNFRDYSSRAESRDPAEPRISRISRIEEKGLGQRLSSSSSAKSA